MNAKRQSGRAFDEAAAADGGSSVPCLIGVFMAQPSRARALDGAHDARIGAAAADVAVHVGDDLLARRLLVLRQQLGRLHDLAGLAVAALRHLLGDPGLLQRMAAGRRQALDGGDLLALDLRDMAIWQERTALPSIWTVQAPHRPEPQPNLVPVSFRCSRTTHSSGVSGSASTVTALLLIVNATAGMRCLLVVHPNANCLVWIVIAPRPAAALRSVRRHYGRQAPPNSLV